MQHLIGEEKERTVAGAVLSLFLLVTKRLYGKEREWSIGQIKTCRKKQHVKIDGKKEMSDLICGKATVGGNYNSTRDSIATEPIENSAEYNEKKLSEEEIKQDCESKAFVRLASKIKKRFPRLPICIVADGLYVSEKVLKICKANKWDYIIRYKEGCAPSIEQEYEAIPEKKKVGGTEYVNGVIFKDLNVNVLKYRETKIKKGEAVTTEFVWITSIEITDKNAKKLVRAGRSRWKIENQGFNRQKHWQGNIEHACSWNERAQKNHYLLEQISDFMKQLYEYFYLQKNEIKKTQKNISSELLASFGRQLTETEDIKTELHNAVLN